LPLEVFTQKKLCGRLSSTEVEFYWQKSKIAFCAILWGLWGSVHGSSMARWKVHGRLPITNWTFFASFQGWSTISGY